MLKKSGLIIFIMMLSGCAMFQQPFSPEQSFDIDADIEELEEQFGQASSIQNYYKSEEAETEERRNKFISGRLTLINIHYIQFIRRFSAKKAQLDTALDMLQLGVDLAITAVGGASAKAALGAASAGISGTRISIDKNFFFEKTVPVLITAMNAQRKEALIPIFMGINSSIEIYPITMAISDLEAYYFAGTFTGGLQAIQKDAGKKDQEMSVEIKKIRGKEFVKEEFQNRIDNLLGAVKKLNDKSAIELVKNPPVEISKDIDKTINLRLVGKERKDIDNGDVAKTMLLQIIVQSDRNEEMLKAWEAAVASQ